MTENLLTFLRDEAVTWYGPEPPPHPAAGDAWVPIQVTAEDRPVYLSAPPGRVRVWDGNEWVSS